MNCREFIEFLADWLGDGLAPAERAVFLEHLAECPDCTAYLQNLEVLVRLERAAFAPDESPLPDEVPEDLVRAILAARI